MLGVVVCLLVPDFAAAADRIVVDPRTPIPRAKDGPGIKFGRHSVFHPGAALAVGYDSNVFYETQGEGRQQAGFITPSAWLGLGNRAVRDDGLLDTPAERTQRKVDYNIALLGGFRQYLSGVDRVLRQSRFTFGALGRLAILPGRRFSIHLDEDLYRRAEPPNFEAGEEFNFNRLNHDGRLFLIGRPGGGRIALTFGYLSSMLYFENDSVTRSDRLINGAFHETKWRFLPRSSILLRYSFRHTYYLQCCTDVGRGRNEDNFSHRLLGGYRGQLAKKIVIEAFVGWGWGYYRQDPNGPDFDSFLGSFVLEYYPTLRSKLYASVARSFHDSLLGNYVDDIGGRVGAQHKFKWRMLASLDVGVTGRTYKGLPGPAGSGSAEDLRVESYEGVDGREDRPDRKDILMVGHAALEQPLGRMFALRAAYRVVLDQTDFVVNFYEDQVAMGATYADPGGFLKHTVMLLGALRY